MDDDARTALPPETPVEVLSAFTQAWVAGFEVVAALPAGYRLRRCSDRALLPAVFAADRVRARF